MHGRHLPLAALAVAVAIIGLSACATTPGAQPPAAASTQTAAAVAPATRYAFAVWGDTRGEGGTTVSTGFQRLAPALATFTFPDSVTVGDYTLASGSASGDRARYDSFLTTAKPLLTGRTTHWIVGNHERVSDPVDHGLYHSQLWDEAVPAGDPAANQRHHWGAFSIPTTEHRVEFFYLSTSEGESGQGSIGFETAKVSTDPQSAWQTQSAQARALVRWLRSRPTKAWVVVVLHHPLYDAKVGAPYDTTAAGSEKMKLVDLFHRYGVDLVLQGDVHHYRRHVQPDGSVYLTQGMGGARPDPASSNDSDTPPLDGRDKASLGSPSSDHQRVGWTLFRVDGSGRLRGATFYVSTQPETVGGVTHAAGETIRLEDFAVGQVKRTAP